MNNNNYHISGAVFDVPKEFLTGMKFVGVALTNLVMIVLLITFALNSAESVHRAVKIPYLIFVVVIGCFWIFPSPFTKGKSNLAQLYMTIFRPRRTFYPIPRVEEPIDAKLPQSIVKSLSKEGGIWS
ncbi:DUF5592 family protein [Lacticaseibacillus sharpeae]|jgi:hypothetical protein|uniref:DUF5592 family protein n=1 Tax=Lacticaseibacillus sharpeae TaxID=1626 RepID=UPI0006D25A6C|nr:DUF5592 family protein [Lacticaseibacillus sharpeae]